MIIRLVQDIRKALENELYFVALSSALTLPDICGKAAYPTERSSRKRYILWYDAVSYTHLKALVTDHKSYPNVC